MALLALQPERWWTAEELRAAVGAPLSSVHRELKRIEDAGILLRDEAAKPHRFKAASDSPLMEPLAELLQRTVGVESDLRRALDLPGVAAAAIHGSWAGPRRGVAHDVDVVVVGDANLRAIRRATREVAARTGRRIDVTLFAAEELRALSRAGRGFAQHLRDDPTIPLIGDLADFLR